MNESHTAAKKTFCIAVFIRSQLKPAADDTVTCQWNILFNPVAETQYVTFDHLWSCYETVTCLAFWNYSSCNIFFFKLECCSNMKKTEMEIK